MGLELEWFRLFVLFPVKWIRARMLCEILVRGTYSRGRVRVALPRCGVYSGRKVQRVVLEVGWLYIVGSLFE